MSGAAWEWRAFAGARGLPDLTEATGDVADRFGVGSGTGGKALVTEEVDAYLLIEGVRDNLKLRSGCLEIKRRVDDGAAAPLSQWADKEIWRFPLDRGRTEDLWASFATLRAGAAALATADSFVAELRQRHEVVPIVVRKRRTRLELGAARLELADVEVTGAAPLRSYCIDGYDRGAVADTVTRSGLAGAAIVASYPELVHALRSGALKAAS